MTANRPPAGPALVAAVREAGGPALELVRRLDGGANAGAWEVELAGGGRCVLTYAGPADATDPGAIARAADVVGLAIRAGVPAPRWLDQTVVAGGGVALLQGLVPGVRAEWVGERWLETMLDLAERRRGLLRGSPHGGRVTSLHLQEPAVGYCEHASLEAHGPRTRRLLDAIRLVGPDEVVGDDLVHYDHHRGNVLVAPDDRDRVVAVVDWGGARGGSVAFDLVCLAADLERWFHVPLAARIDRELERAVPEDELRRFRAHVALRYVDWMIRHDLSMLDGWLTIAERYVLG